MAVLELPAPTRDEQEAFDFNPIPSLAPATGCVTMMPFQLALALC